MRLISEVEQSVQIGNARIALSADEHIVTEHSHKYTLEGFAGLAQAAGFKVEKVWMDVDRLFSVQYCVRD